MESSQRRLMRLFWRTCLLPKRKPVRRVKRAMRRKTVMRRIKKILRTPRKKVKITLKKMQVLKIKRTTIITKITKMPMRRSNINIIN